MDHRQVKFARKEALAAVYTLRIETKKTMVFTKVPLASSSGKLVNCVQLSRMNYGHVYINYFHPIANIVRQYIDAGKMITPALVLGMPE